MVMVVLIDGGFSTQLKKHLRVDDAALAEKPLWCAEFVKTNSDAVVKTHADYVAAGCDVILTNTYQASVDGFHKYLGLDRESSIDLMKRAVQLAKQASETTGNGCSVLVAGSVGPYGACLHDGSEYTGTYIETLTQQQLMDWHRPRIQALVEAGVDLLAVETIPAVGEAVAVLTLLKNEFPNQKAWISFTCKDELHISHGETLKEAVAQCCQINRDQLVAVGINCSNPVFIADLLRSAQDVPQRPPFVVYPNLGATWTPGVGWTDIDSNHPLVHYLPEWISLGAEYIGGCCQTTAEDMKSCREYLDSKIK
ncbi:uncharacterized protein LOC129001692 isoform X1 [Macrosteles quadrilineatus]|uniref:uncharacterized protein LOC129001692 isoform X1 n=1 Tax=Macrosteles quadrilineatus TaxID=74068 RepID=UPI0023E32D8A|nr:uncharacterized protein LOC129001692 isoform X1 [Macrosteles quadrilineatus]XP_054285060.1 uncharacterized protein LOC129001692 isoform X1 [Macrosteles quadrilineatus]XP_054285061.1 uncharacterized protein LOC129001692 isoform X1 [Macrosteles quadrilineatus]